MVDKNVVPAAQVVMSIFPIVGVLMATLLLLLYILWQHKETVLLIRNGMYKPSKMDFLDICLLSGILLLVVGSALTIFFISIEKKDYTLLLGILPFSIGFALLIYYKVVHKTKRKKDLIDDNT